MLISMRVMIRFHISSLSLGFSNIGRADCNYFNCIYINFSCYYSIEHP